VLALALMACAPKAPVETPVVNNHPGYVLVESGDFLGGLQAHHYSFDNGLRLFVVPDDSAPVVAYHTWFGVGSSDEQLGKTGLAHLFEHMMFKGTTTYDDGHYDTVVEGLGAEGLNAWTWLDETVYIQSIPVAGLATLAELEATRMTTLVVNAEALDSEREVVINERRLRTDNDPDGKLNEKLWNTAFTTHTYGWPTVGWEADLQALSVEDCVDFYETWYAPNNATLVLVGDVEPAATAQLIQDTYGHLQASTLARRPLPTEPDQTAQRRVEVDIATTSDRLQVGFVTPDMGHPDIPALQVLDAILTTGQSGRLKRALQDTGLAGSVSSFFLGMQEPGLLELTANSRVGVPAEMVEESMFDALETLKRDGVTAAEVERGVNQIRAEAWEGLESASGKAELLGWHWTAGGDWRLGVTHLDALARITPEDVRRVARTWLNPAHSTVGIGRATQAPVDALRPTVSAIPTFEPGPPIQARASEALPRLARGHLAEGEVAGATFMFLFDPTAPLLHLNLGWKHGADVDELPGVAHLTAHALLRGTDQRNRLQFEEHIERLGANVWPSVSADSLTLYATVPRDAWPEFVALLTEALTQPAFDPSTIDELKDEVRNELKESLDSDRDLLSRAALSALYGPDHPYGRSELGTLESLDAITPEHLAAYHDTWLRSSNAVLALGGAFDAKARGDVAELLEALAGDVPDVTPAEPPAPREGRTVLIVDKPERTQVQAMVLQPGAAYQADTFPAYLLGNDVVGGFSFQARLMQQVRVERGWSYYAYGFTRTRVHGGPYLAILAPGVEYATDAVSLVIDILGQAKAEGVSQEDLDQARSARVQGAPFLSDTPAKRLDNLFDLHLRGYDEPAYVAAMADVTLDQANAAIAALYDPDNALVVLVATAADVMAGAEALGPVTVVPISAVK